MTELPKVCVTVPGVRLSIAAVDPAAPIGRQAIDSFLALPVLQKPTSIPPVSRTWVLSARVVFTPPIVSVTVGATAIGVHWLPGKPLVSKSSELAVSPGGFSARMTLSPAGTVNDPHRSKTLPPAMDE